MIHNVQPSNNNKKKESKEQRQTEKKQQKILKTLDIKQSMVGWFRIKQVNIKTCLLFQIRCVKKFSDYDHTWGGSAVNKKCMYGKKVCHKLLTCKPFKFIIYFFIFNIYLINI